MRGGFNGRFTGSKRGLETGRGDFDARTQGKANVVENYVVSANRQRNVGIEREGEDYARIARYGLVGGRIAHNAQRTVGKGVGHERVAERAVARAQRTFCQCHAFGQEKIHLEGGEICGAGIEQLHIELPVAAGARFGYGGLHRAVVFVGSLGGGRGEADRGEDRQYYICISFHGVDVFSKRVF